MITCILGLLYVHTASRPAPAFIAIANWVNDDIYIVSVTFHDPTYPAFPFNLHMYDSKRLSTRVTAIKAGAQYLWPCIIEWCKFFYGFNNWYCCVSLFWKMAKGWWMLINSYDPSHTGYWYRCCCPHLIILWIAIVCATFRWPYWTTILSAKHAIAL